MHDALLVKIMILTKHMPSVLLKKCYENNWTKAGWWPVRFSFRL